jgi:hypothetical protein
MRTGTNKLNRNSSKEEIKISNKYIKKWSISLAIKKMKTTTTLRFHLIPMRIAIIRTQTTLNVGEDVGKKESLHTVGENVN